MIYFFIAFMFSIFFWQAKRLLFEKEYRELVIFAIFHIITIIYGVMVILDIRTVNPFSIIIYVFDKI